MKLGNLHDLCLSNSRILDKDTDFLKAKAMLDDIFSVRITQSTIIKLVRFGCL